MFAEIYSDKFFESCVNTILLRNTIDFILDFELKEKERENLLSLTSFLCDELSKLVEMRKGQIDPVINLFTNYLIIISD